MSAVDTSRAARAAGRGEWPTRLLSGIALAIVAVAAVWYPKAMAALLAVLCLFAAREWHRMVRTIPTPQSLAHWQTIVTAAAVALGIVAVLYHLVWAGFAVLVAGAAAAFLVARAREDNAAWHALGVLYIGVPALSLMSLRLFSPVNGALLVIGLFLIIWSTDTGALLVGRLVGGPKLAPTISPGKTWSGTLGGSIIAAMVYGLYIAVLDHNVPLAMLFALVFSATAHLGDLLESSFKRRFGTKDTGGLIPGHGGALDRLDSTFAAVPVMAALVFGLPLLGISFNPLFGGYL